MKLTATGIKSLKAKDETREETYRDTQVQGLLLEVHPSGVRSFVAWGRVRATGRGWRLTLGRYQEGVYDLADAREDARKALALGRTENPSEARKRERQAGTFGKLVEAFLADAQVRPATLTSWTALLGHERLAGLRSRRTSEITRGDLVRLLDGIRDASLAKKGKGYSANRTLEAVRRTFNWAIEKAIIQTSPCVGIKKSVKERPRRISYDSVELGAVVRALRQSDSAMAGACLLALFTGVRIETALGATWAEVDLKGKEWLISGERAGTKNGLPWLVPLSAPAVALLRARANDTPFVFPTRSRKGEPTRAARSQKYIYALRTLPGVPETFRPHDCRRTLNTWLASRPGGAEPLEVRDAVLGHAKRGLEQNYNQHEYETEKRDALARWAAHVERLAAAKPAKVVRIA